MKPLALSTMFAQQDRFADGAAFARFAAEAGYDAIEISHSTREVKLRQILESNLLPVTSVHQPAPWSRHGDGRGNSHCNLASIDPGERAAAVAYARASIDWAGEIGATRLVVHLGAVTDVPEQFPEELEMRQMFDSGRAAESRFTDLRNVVIENRRKAAEPHLAAARGSLHELVALAAPRGITIGLENRYHFHEIPHPGEYEELLQGLDLSQAGYWHDTGHAEVLHRLGFIDRHEWLDQNAHRIVGAHLHDVIGLGDHRSPGDGDVDWGYITADLRQLPAYTLEINQHQPDERVRSAPAYLESVGLR
jgi:sugar phosphate isomerase/epimerase